MNGAARHRTAERCRPAFPRGPWERGPGDFVDLVAEAVEPAATHHHPNLIRLHALWSKTGSRRLGRKLVEYGVVTRPARAIN